MKRPIFLLSFFLIFSFILVSAAPSPQPVWGIMTVDGERAASMQVSVENLATHETIFGYTGFDGGWVQDFSEFTQGWSSSQNFKVTYCISDSRCAQVFAYLDFDLDCSPDGCVISKNLARSGGGLVASFPVYGIVKKDGVVQDGVRIVIDNVDKSFTESMDTNVEGEFNFNLANLGSYDTGDLIRVTALEKSVEGFVSNAGFLKLDVNFMTPVVVPDTNPQEGDNNGGGRNDGPQGDVIKPEPIVDPVVPVPEPVVEPVDVPIDEPVKDPVVTPPVDDEPSKAWIWILIIVVIAVIGLGYYFVKKDNGVC